MPAELSYGIQRSLRGKRLARTFVVLVCCCLIGGGVWMFAAPLRRRMTICLAQVRLEKAWVASDVVVYEDLPIETKGLLPEIDHTISVKDTSGICRIRETPVAFRTICDAAKAPYILPRDATLYLGYRTTPDGRKCIVAVLRQTLGRPWDSSDTPFRTVVILPGTLWNDPVFRADPVSYHYRASDIETGQSLRFYAGSNDSISPSAFSITYEVNGERKIVHGHLTDSLNVAFRTESTTPHSSP